MINHHGVFIFSRLLERIQRLAAFVLRCVHSWDLFSLWQASWLELIKPVG
ncbi:hypothetical protein SynPROS71_01077 [Synechococcus sp. PROS-7-1]|nr:hypothetical protein SynPROS71_01077 [Synechococcus sp. PROS-7-1]